MHRLPAPTFDRALVWLRRDLRLHDHAALHHAMRTAREVFCAFVFDRDILDPLPRIDRRVEFIRESLVPLDEQLRQAGSGLLVRHGRAVDELPRLAAALGVQAVFANHDDEPAALSRDERVRTALRAQGIGWHDFKDHVVLERREVMTGAGTPYGVFTPYKNAWLKTLKPEQLAPWACDGPGRFGPVEPAGGVPTLQDIGFAPSNLASLPITPGSAGGRALLDDFAGRIDRYHEQRDFPAVRGPSYLSVHLRFGTVSVREAMRLAVDHIGRGSAGAEVWRSELIWRDFYHQVLHHHPHVATQAFKPEYDRIAWDTGADADARFAAWCEGRTGYPLVDAAMAQINHSGYMHNRLRMVVASFLTKDLGLDWRRGEAYFAEQLIDFDLAANNGGWQWAASSGCDAQPWFRIFNPVTQSEKFDAGGQFIRRYLPQLARLPDRYIHAPWTARPIDLAAAGVHLGRDYPRPVVDHALAREQTLRRYAVVKSPAGSTPAPPDSP